MSVLSLIDRLIHFLISIVNNKCKYPGLCFPLIEALFYIFLLLLYIYIIEFVHEICL